MTGEESHSEVFVSGHLAQEKEKKGAPVGLRTEPGTPATLLVPCPRAFKSPVEDPSGKNLGIGMVLFPLNNGQRPLLHPRKNFIYITDICICKGENSKYGNKDQPEQSEPWVSFQV